MPTPAVRLLSPSDDAHLVPSLAALHAACIRHDSMIATFLPPLKKDKLLMYWKEMIEDASAGRRLIAILLDESEPGTVAKGAELKGVVMLLMPRTETARHQGHIQKLMVSVECRREKGATALMRFIEREAVNRGRKLMLLSAETQSQGELLFPKLGYVKCGRVPGFHMSPTGDLMDHVLFYKQFL
ncbi:hypothetical protein EKO27_g4692 [Xylaria grammica]|uniref:N-acetyltransferase domain-containing protein n=1 Tax=Xylaria grammica TaxID=363999 RepID=A0A439D7N5_9PEZI|nr:hypothetical protein EKO27_g4692 [Xylaria grammica]